MTGPAIFGIGSDTWPGLAKLGEECGEVVQVIMKLLAIDGAENYDHWDGTNLAERLTEEIGDLQAAIWFVCRHNADKIHPMEIAKRAQAKLELFNKWHYEP